MIDKDIYLHFKISKLIAGKKMGILTENEEDELHAWLAGDPDRQRIYNNLLNDKDLHLEIRKADSFDTAHKFIELSRQTGLNSSVSGRIIRMPAYIKYAAAILALIAISVTTLLFWPENKGRHSTTDIQEKHRISKLQQPVFKPGTQKAMLITSSKDSIILGENSGKQVFTDHLTQITNAEHTLFYASAPALATDREIIEYNELITPRGGEYSLVLSDDTKVFINADSRIRFPVKFSGNSREIELEGEAYFEVTHETNRPFIIHTETMDIRVYGTRFNVSSYSEDEFAHTTLIEGLVGIRLDEEELLIYPGHQAKLNKSTNEIAIDSVKADLYTSWTKGFFKFENETLENILFKLKRWYDFEVVFVSAELKQSAFTADLKRYEDINPILNMISSASNIVFRIKEKTIYVNKDESAELASPSSIP